MKKFLECGSSGRDRLAMRLVVLYRVAAGCDVSRARRPPAIATRDARSHPVERVEMRAVCRVCALFATRNRVLPPLDSMTVVCEADISCSCTTHRFIILYNHTHMYKEFNVASYVSV